MEDTRTEAFKSSIPVSDTTRKVRYTSADRILDESESRPVKSAGEQGERKPDASSYLGMAREETDPRKDSTPSGVEEAAPLSAALGIPTLVKEKDDYAAASAKGDADVYLSSKWFPLLSDNATPLSTALNIPVLLNESTATAKVERR